jgi:hypothetical protein
MYIEAEISSPYRPGLVEKLLSESLNDANRLQ